LQHLILFYLETPAKFRFAGTINSVVFYILQKDGIPFRDPEGPLVDPSHLKHLAFFYLDLPAKFHFYWDSVFSDYITRCTFTSSRKLAHLVETSRGPYVDPSHLQLLTFFYLDLPAKFHFTGTVHSVAASQDAILHPPGSWHTL
jgi:hypothetical protein